MLTRRNIGNLVIIAAVLVNLVLWAIFLPRDSGRPNLTREIGGEIIGATAMILFACALFLSTRPRFAESFFGGLDRMYQAHKRSAMTGFLLIFVHLFFVPINVNEPKPGTVGGMIAFLGFVFLVLLTIAPRVPILGRVTRTAYHRWKISHRFIGIFFMIAFGHSLFVEPILLSLPVVFGYYVAFYVLGLFSYLYAELISPFLRKRYPYTVSDVKVLKGSTVEVTMEPKKDKLPYTAGQFLFVKFDGDSLLREAHPFTVSSSPREGVLRLSIKGSGDFTRHLPGALRPGMGAVVEGAYGRFNYKNGGPRQIWVAGGIGITPFLSWTRDLGDGPDRTIDFFYTVRNVEEAFYRHELDDATRRWPNFKVHPVFSSLDGSLTIDRIVQRTQGSIAERDVYLCGPIAMTESFAEKFRKLGVPTNRIHFEEFNFR